MKMSIPIIVAALFVCITLAGIWTVETVGQLRTQLHAIDQRLQAIERRLPPPTDVQFEHNIVGGSRETVVTGAVPFRQGMTLMPGQSAVVEIPIPQDDDVRKATR